MDATDVSSILAEREKTHGNFREVAETFTDIADALGLAPGFQDPVTFMVLTMISMKLARIKCGDPWHADHYLDLAGYALLAVKAIKEGASE